MNRTLHTALHLHLQKSKLWKYFMSTSFCRVAFNYFEKEQIWTWLFNRHIQQQSFFIDWLWRKEAKQFWKHFKALASELLLLFWSQAVLYLTVMLNSQEAFPISVKSPLPQLPFSKENRAGRDSDYSSDCMKTHIISASVTGARIALGTSKDVGKGLK